MTNKSFLKSPLRIIGAFMMLIGIFIIPGYLTIFPAASVTITSSNPTALTFGEIGGSSLQVVAFSNGGSNTISFPGIYVIALFSLQTGATVSSATATVCGGNCTTLTLTSAICTTNGFGTTSNCRANVLTSSGSHAGVTYTVALSITDTIGTTSQMSFSFTYVPPIASYKDTISVSGASGSPYTIACSADQSCTGIVSSLNVTPSQTMQITVTFVSQISSVTSVTGTCTSSPGSCPTITFTNQGSGVWVSNAFTLPVGTYSLNAAFTQTGQSNPITMFSLIGGVSPTSGLPNFNFPNMGAGIAIVIVGFILVARRK